MARLILLCVPVLLGLLGAAIYVQVDSGRLRLPISGVATGLLTALPLCAAANVVVWWARATAPAAPLSKRRLQHREMFALLPAALQAAQGMLTAALATLFLAALAGWPAGNPLDCALQATWTSWWSAKDYQAIRTVQDALACCGFKSVKDMPWPPQDKENNKLPCSDPPGHRDFCALPWHAAARRDLSVALAVAVTIGILQAAALLIPRRFPTPDGAGLVERVFRGHPRAIAAESSRPLLSDAEAGVESMETGDERSQPRYGGVPAGESGPRIVPSSQLDGEGNHWGRD